jgi:hypothetical protein
VGEKESFRQLPCASLIYCMRTRPYPTGANRSVS